LLACVEFLPCAEAEGREDRDITPLLSYTHDITNNIASHHQPSGAPSPTMHPSIPLTTAEAFSGILGSISLAAWIFLLVPQLIENHTNGHADGISMTFLFIWAAGDILSLAGGLWAGLVPTVIALAIYFCFADGALITQCIYYNTLNAQKDKEAKEEADSQAQEQDPLLAAANAAGHSSQRKPSTTSRRSHRRSSARSRRDSLSRALAKPTATSAWVKNSLSILAIVVAGTAGWALAYKTGAWHPVPLKDPASSTPTPLGASLLGYGSALLYLGARVPQIVKNQRERSCDGLSLLFFLLSLLGNATYGAGILCHSLEREYVWTNLPWLIGSLGTMVEDLVIFAQFRSFGEAEKEEGEAVV
jgi:uncharacterized protein with PQ loop repeat